MPDHMKPSECGAIVLLDRPWNGRQVIRAIPTGLKIPAETLEWLMELSRKQFIPLLFNELLLENGVYTGRKDVGYGPKSFILAVQNEIGPQDVMML